MPNYSHTQKGLIHWLCFGLAIFFFGMTQVAPPEPALQLTFGLSGGVCALVGLCVRSLTVTDCGDQLQVTFGPLPCIRKSFAYSEIVEVKTAKSKLIDGFGAHYFPGRGWTFNIHGFACVELKLTSGRTIRIGSDDSEQLAELIGERMQSNRSDSIAN